MTAVISTPIVVLMANHPHHEHYAPDHTPWYLVVVGVLLALAIIVFVSAFLDWLGKRCDRDDT